MNGLTAAKGLRRSVESAGGLMRISVPALGDAFGRGKLTGRAKAGIEGVLARAGVQVIPSLTDPANDGWVTLRVTPTAPTTKAAPIAPTAESATLGTTSGATGRTHRTPAAVIAAALAFLVPVLLVLALASPDANRPGRAAADSTPAPTPTTTTPGTLLEQADDALLAGDYRLAVRLTTQADAAKVPALRARIAAALITQARTAQSHRAYVRAIQLARRAARYGPAPEAGTIVRQSRAGLDLRREAQRRAEGR